MTMLMMLNRKMKWMEVRMILMLIQMMMKMMVMMVSLTMVEMMSAAMMIVVMMYAMMIYRNDASLGLSLWLLSKYHREC
jgi:hypothetical protein